MTQTDRIHPALGQTCESPRGAPPLRLPIGQRAHSAKARFPLLPRQLAPARPFHPKDENPAPATAHTAPPDSPATAQAVAGESGGAVCAVAGAGFSSFGWNGRAGASCRGKRGKRAFAELSHIHISEP